MEAGKLLYQNLMNQLQGERWWKVLKIN
jgi:hypothetical protein